MPLHKDFPKDPYVILDPILRWFPAARKRSNTETSPKVATKGKHKIAIKVVDIFGNDTTRVIEVKI